MGKLQYQLNLCPFFNNDQWLTIVECCFLLYHPNRNVNYNITNVFPQYYIITHFEPFSASHATVQWRQWYPVQYQSPKLTNSLLSPWPLSLDPHQEQSRLYTIASRKVRKEQTLALVIIMFSCLWCLFPLSWRALIWCVQCLNMDLTVLYTKTSITVPDNRGILCALRNQDPAVWKIHSRNSAVFLDYVVPKIPRSGSVVLVFVYNTVYNFCCTSFCVQ